MYDREDHITGMGIAIAVPSFLTWLSNPDMHMFWYVVLAAAAVALYWTIWLIRNP